MRQVFLGATVAAALMSPAMAADPAVMDPIIDLPVASLYDWTGFYIGGHVGGGRSHVDWTYVAGGNTADHRGSGAFGGIQAGFNLQTGNWVFGVEGDVSGAGIDGGTSCPNPAFSCDSDISMLGSIRARAGYAFDRVLIYGTGGFGFGRVEISTTSAALGTNGTTRTETGWTVGGGVEYAFGNRWSLKGEYMYYDLGSSNYTVDNGLVVNADTRLHTGKIGINYKF